MIQNHCHELYGMLERGAAAAAVVVAAIHTHDARKKRQSNTETLQSWSNAPEKEADNYARREKKTHNRCMPGDFFSSKAPLQLLFLCVCDAALNETSAAAGFPLRV
jgi:hypothetical protein